MASIHVIPVHLHGERLRLEPLCLDHVPGLAAAIDPNYFRFFGGVTVATNSEEEVTRYVTARLALSNTLSFVMVQNSDNRVAGHSSFMNIRAYDRVVEIGSTWIGKEFQGTFVNPEAKFLMLQHAFETLGCVRVELKTDERNLQSQNAMQKLGLVREGVLRKHATNADGFVRNSVYFSCIDDEWPGLKVRLQARLAQFPVS